MCVPLLRRIILLPFLPKLITIRVRVVPVVPVGGSVISSPCHELLVMQVLWGPVPESFEDLVHGLVLPTLVC